MLNGTTLSQFVHGKLWNIRVFFVAVHFGSVFSLLDKNDGRLIGSNLLLVCQILTVKIAFMWDVIWCSVVDKN